MDVSRSLPINPINFIVILSVSFSMMMASNKSEEICPNVSLACNKFALDLHKALCSASKDNVIFSPLSAHIILSLVSYGAEGKTLKEMEDGLHLAEHTPARDEFKSLLNTFNNVKGVGLSLANAIFIQQGSEETVIPNFLDVSKNVFDCMLSNVDFAQGVETAKTINEWVDKATKNKITDALSPSDINYLTRFVLINAIHFKGDWLNQFDTKHTRDEKFYVTKSYIKSVPTMVKTFKYSHGELEDWNAKFLEIPYVDENFSMIIILPNEIEGLRSLEAKFSWDILKTARRSHEKIELHLPKFELEARIDLEEALTKLGCREMFTANANFCALANIPGLHVTKAFQKIYIKVNEEGSEAAAVTVVLMGFGCAPRRIEEFRVDHPFMLVIQHKPSNMPLFFGSVRDIL